MRVIAIQRVLAWLLVLGLASFLAWCALDGSGDAIAPRGGPAFIRHVVHWGVFRGEESGHPACRWPARLPIDLLEPGDIILAHNPHAVYGYWSHATLYLGDGQVLHQDLISGIGTAPVDWLAWYDELEVVRPDASPALRAAAAAWAGRLDGGLFNLLARPDDPCQWTCASSVYEAYQAQGLDVGDGRSWITPDALASGPCRLLWHGRGQDGSW